MENDAPHLGTYQWTRGPGEANPRPMWGSDEHLKAQAELDAKRAHDLQTPEGQAWLKRHGG